MEFVVKKTNELSTIDKLTLVNLFNDVFDKKRTLQDFDNLFLNNHLGFSYHSIFINDDRKIVGSYSFIPDLYKVNGTLKLFVLGVDNMIHKKFRGIENFYDIFSTACRFMKKDGVDFVIGFPNNMALPVFESTKLLLKIGKLNTYFIPLNIGGLKQSLTIFNPLSSFICKLWIGVCSVIARSKPVYFPIQKETERFNSTRYNRIKTDYTEVNFSNLQFYYIVKKHEGIRTAFLIDVTEKSEKNFCKAAKFIIKKEQKNIDLLIYVGSLPFHFSGMIKIPHIFEPKNFNFSGIGLAMKDFDDNFIYNINNWDLNLSNSDLI